MEIAKTGAAKPPFLEFEESTAGGAKAGIEKPQEGFSIQGKLMSKFHERLLYWRGESGSRGKGWRARQKRKG